MASIKKVLKRIVEARKGKQVFYIIHILLFHEYITGLDTNGCPLGNSKFILLSDNLNICLWLSACQVEKIDPLNNS